MTAEPAAAPGGQPGAGAETSCGNDTTSVTQGPGNLTFAKCLRLLDLDDDELLSFGTLVKGGTREDFKGRQYKVGNLKALDLSAYADHNVWCGLQPMRKSPTRGNSDDVVRVAALYADLDIAPNKMPDRDSAIDVIDALSNMLGATPTYVTFSGHGYQPVWAIDGSDSLDVDVLKSLMPRWGQLVKQTATEIGGNADSVFDPARILRVPGTVNWKQTSAPVPTWAVDDLGGPVSAAQIEEALDGYLRPEQEPRPVTPFVAHTATDKSCRYTRNMIDHWQNDEPFERHPWATRNGMKLACLQRLGCITDADFSRGVEVLVECMTALCARDGDDRSFERTEIVGKPDSIIESAITKAAGYDEATLWEKTGNHDHTDPDDLSWIPTLEASTSDDAPKRADQVPPVHPAVWHGPLGDYVKAIAPKTESDPLAVLVQALAWAGCRMGRDVWLQFGNTRHYPLIYPLIVGPTSAGRKGNSEHDSLTALSALSALPRRRSGLSSGEGLIEAFMSKKDGEPAPDPRLLIVETEWESVLARASREGNTLSPVIRDAWDGRPLATMNAGGASREVTHHALVIVGHITPQALREGMTGKDLSNGFLNRFLIVSVMRPHLVEWPEPMTEIARTALSTIATKRPGYGEFLLSPQAKKLYTDWYRNYSTASDRLSERVAMATARAVPNLLRVAMIYADLDETDNVIEEVHVRAAIALVDNSCASSQTLLAPGRAGLDGKILSALRDKGQMTRNDLRDHFNRHVSAADLDEALKTLADSGEIETASVTDTGGRHATVYRAVARNAREAR